MSFHGPGRPPPLAGADDVDRLDLGENVDLQLLADLEAVGRAADLADESFRLAPGLGYGFCSGRGEVSLTFAIQLSDVSATAADSATARNIHVSQLDCLVPVPLLALQLQHMARAGLDHSHRDDLAGRVVNLCHPDLSAE